MIDESLHKKPTVEKHEEVNEEKQHRFVGRWHKKPGQILFAYNKHTNELKRAEIETQIIAVFDPKTNEYKEKKKHKIVREPGWFYFWSLNEKNAWKKIVDALGLNTK